MFSVGASPYNSMGRQLYGGWTSPGNADLWTQIAGTADDVGREALIDQNFNAAEIFQASKWANLAARLSTDPGERAMARVIKRALKGYVGKSRRESPAFRAAYAAALANVRSPWRKPPLPRTSRATLWNFFKQIPWEGITGPQKAFISMASKAPYTVAPRSSLPDEWEAAMVSGPYYNAEVGDAPRFAGITPTEAQLAARGAWNIGTEPPVVNRYAVRA